MITQWNSWFTQERIDMFLRRDQNSGQGPQEDSFDCRKHHLCLEPRLRSQGQHETLECLEPVGQSSGLNSRKGPDV